MANKRKYIKKKATKKYTKKSTKKYEDGGVVNVNEELNDTTGAAANSVLSSFPVVGAAWGLGKSIYGMTGKAKRGAEYKQLLQQELMSEAQRNKGLESRRKQKLITDTANLGESNNIDGYFEDGGQVTDGTFDYMKNGEVVQEGIRDYLKPAFDRTVMGGGLSGFFGASKKQLAEFKDKIAERKAKDEYNQQLKLDNRALDSYNINGVPSSGFYVKGGVIPGQRGRMQTFINRGVNTDARQKQAGVAGIEVETDKQGTDKINANIGGNQVKLDDNEVIVKTSNGKDVVLSDDLGEATKYKQAISKAKSPEEEQQIADVFAERAIQLNPNPGKKLDGGGSAGSALIGGSTMGAIGGGTSMFNNSLGVFPQYSGQGFQNVDSFNNSGFTNSPFNSSMFGNYSGQGYENVDDFNVNQDNYLLNGQTNTRFGNWVRGIDWKKAAPQMVNFGLAAAQTISNANAAKRLRDTPYPKFKYPIYKSLDPDANKPLYAKALGDTKAAYNKTAMTLPRYTTSANDLTNRLANLSSAQSSSMGNVYAQQVSDRNRIINADTQAENQFTQNRAISEGRYDSGKYSDSINRINTQVGLNNSTIGTIQNLMTGIQKGQYQKEELMTMGAQYGLEFDGSESISDMYTALATQFKALIEAYANGSSNYNPAANSNIGNLQKPKFS